MAKIWHPKNDPSIVKDDAASWDKVPTNIKIDEILSVDLKVGNEFTPDKPSKGDK